MGKLKRCGKNDLLNFGLKMGTPCYARGASRTPGFPPRPRKNMSLLILKVLILEFLIGVALSLYEKNYPMAMYYAGAALLNVGILLK
jgi:hypothetical protein